MIRARLACFKHIAWALLLLVVAVCSIEVGLRIHAATTVCLAVPSQKEEGVGTRDWSVHHRLKPFQKVYTTHADSGERVKFRTNSLGLRGPELEIPKPPGVYRVVCLGDETVLAAGLSENDTFCGQLQGLLQGQTRLQVEVVNAGVPGYCPLLSYLQYRHLLLGLQADLVIHSFDMSDVSDDHRYRRHTHMDADQSPLACPHPELATPRKEMELQKYDQFHVVRWAKQQMGLLPLSDTNPNDLRNINASEGQTAWLSDHPPDWSLYIQQALAPLESLHELSRKSFAECLVATYPEPWQVSRTASSGAGVREGVGVPQGGIFASRKPFETLEQYCAERKILFLDASPQFQSAERPDRLFLKNAARLSAQGHELYARLLAAFIVQEIPGIWHAPGYSPNEPQRTASAVRRE